MWFHECPQTPVWTALALACPICSMPTILFSQFFCHVGVHRLFHLITWQPKIQAVFCPSGSTCSRTCLRNCHQNRIAGPAAWLSSRPRSQLKKACQFPLGAFIFLFRTHHRFLPNPKTTPIADLSSKRFHSLCTSRSSAAPQLLSACHRSCYPKDCTPRPPRPCACSLWLCPRTTWRSIVEHFSSIVIQHSHLNNRIKD